MVEFVSANPTGPLVAASGRHAAYGDALARILEHHGHAVRASTTSTTPAARSGCSANQSRRARGARRCPRAATRASTSPSSPPRSPVRLAIPTRSRRARSSAAGADQGHAGALRRALRQVLQRADAARGIAERGRAGAAMLGAGGHVYRSTARCGCGRQLRGRQGPGRGAIQRRADVPRGRHRVHPEQARARVRPAAPAGRRRPPRVRARAEGRDGRARRRSRHDRVPMLQFVHLVEGGEASRCPSVAAIS